MPILRGHDSKGPYYKVYRTKTKYHYLPNNEIGTFMTGLFVLLDKCTEKKNCFKMLLLFLRYGILTFAIFCRQSFFSDFLLFFSELFIPLSYYFLICTLQQLTFSTYALS